MDEYERALVQIEPCYMKASCINTNRGGIYNCDGCIGGGQRITTKDPHIVKVEVSDTGSIVSIILKD